VTSTLTTPGATNGHGPGPIGSVQRVEPRLRRRRTHLLGAVALLIVAGLAAVFIVQQIQTQNRVVQVRADIPRGATIKAGDLAEVTVGPIEGVSTVPADELPELVGQRATIDLARGSLLPEGGIGAVAIPAAGQALVGIRLEQGRMVIGDVAIGSRLRLVVTAPQGGDPSFRDGNSGRQFAAVLIESSPALDGAATLVNVQVAAKDASLIAQLAATSRLAIVQDPQR
jgi:hypothetical protein